MDGWIPEVNVQFRGRSANIDFFVAEVEESIFGVDAVAHLNMTLTVHKEHTAAQQPAVKC
jgi:hypothetical protein